MLEKLAWNFLKGLISSSIIFLIIHGSRHKWWLLNEKIIDANHKVELFVCLARTIGAKITIFYYDCFSVLILLIRNLTLS